MKRGFAGNWGWTVPRLSLNLVEPGKALPGFRFGCFEILTVAARHGLSISRNFVGAISGAFMPDNTLPRVDAALSPEALLGWLRQIVADRDLPPSATNIAVALSLDFTEVGSAFIASKAIAVRAGVHLNSVHTAMGALRRNGHIAVTPILAQPNIYAPLIRGA